MDASINMVSLLGALDIEEFRPRPSNTAASAVEKALEHGWVEGQKTRPNLHKPDQFRLTPSGDRMLERFVS